MAWSPICNNRYKDLIDCGFLIQIPKNPREKISKE